MITLALTALSGFGLLGILLALILPKESATEACIACMAAALLTACGILAVFWLISRRERRALEDIGSAARHISEGELHARVKEDGDGEMLELSLEFNRMAEALCRMEEEKNDFLSSVAHDMKTPMMTVQGFIDCILDGSIAEDERDRYLGIIREETLRLSRLVSALLDVSRISSGRHLLRRESFDICEVGRQCFFSFEQRIEQKRLEVELDTERDNMYAVGDRDAIYRIMYNITDNAVKFSREGGALRLSVRYTEDGKVRASVYNEGQGIPYEDQPYIFDRFYRSDGGRASDRSGVGLGMFIAKTVIDAHGEELTLESTPGEYCKFSFTLPRGEDPRQTGERKGSDK